MSALAKHIREARDRHSRQCGYTLVELVASVAVMAILMAGMGSAMVIASRGIPDGNTSLEITAESGAVLDQIASDLLYATSITEKSANAVTFTVADRNHGDPGEETIRYAWSGTEGDPLTREYNGGTAAILIENAYDFRLIYSVGSDTEPSIPVIEGPETLLSSQDTSADLKDFAITDKEWIGQYFFPTLPVDAIAWNVTRVKFMARIHGADKGITAVQLRPATAARLPDTTLLEEVPMEESALGEEYLWQEFSYSTVSGLAPSQGLCLVLACQENDAHLGDVQYDDGSGTARLTTTDEGSNWNYDSDKSMLYYVYGTATVPDPDPPPPDLFLHSVVIRLRAAEDASTELQTEVQILNTPEVTGL